MLKRPQAETHGSPRSTSSVIAQAEDIRCSIVPDAHRSTNEHRIIEFGDGNRGTNRELGA